MSKLCDISGHFSFQFYWAINIKIKKGEEVRKSYKSKPFLLHCWRLDIIHTGFTVEGDTNSTSSGVTIPRAFSSIAM